MKATKVIYSRLISKGNYENVKIEIELEVEKGEKASDVFNAILPANLNNSNAIIYPFLAIFYLYHYLGLVLLMLLEQFFELLLDLLLFLP